MDHIKKLEYEKYKGLEKPKKIQELNLFWNTEKSLLRGKIKRANKEKTSLHIGDITNLKGEVAPNPFSGKSFFYIVSEEKDKSNSRSDMSEELNVNDEIVFKFEIQEKRHEENDANREDSRPIIADYSSIKFVRDMNQLLKKLQQENIEATFIDSIRCGYADERVVFSEDILDLLAGGVPRVTDELTKRKEEIDKLDQEILKLDKTIVLKKEALEELDDLSRKYDRLGFKTFYKTDLIEREIRGKTDITNKQEQIDYIQRHLGSRKEKSLYYEKHIIEKFFLGLSTNQIMVLSGEPGTGKTSLVEGFAQTIGAKYTMVPVQPNWTDNQDLLGFYNPIEKTYVSTPFLDAIINAAKDPDHLHIVCLDEMNLAHVEYYFSEFLSKLQTSKRKLDLYSDYIHERIGAELHGKILGFLDEYVDFDINNKSQVDELIYSLDLDEKEERFKLLWQWDMYKRYPSSMKIPDNIRFVGTVNKDETTKNLSPKVIDRSFVIEVEGSLETIKDDFLENTNPSENEFEERLLLGANNFTINRLQLDKPTFRTIKGILKQLNIHLNNRFDDGVCQVSCRI